MEIGVTISGGMEKTFPIDKVGRSMMELDLMGQKTVVVGFGGSGRATAEFLLDRGAWVTVSDSAGTEEMFEKARSLEQKGATIEFGGHRIETFGAADLIVLSPGVPPSIPPILEAGRKGVRITGELELASRFIEEPILAVTGTNGKTTTVTLLGEILKVSNKKVFVGGNIGRPLIEYVSSRQKVDLVVIEVSSFQMETIETLKPAIGVLLNVSPDHMDRYPDYDAYFKAKAGLFMNQTPEDTAILNEDDPLVAGLNVKARRFGFSFLKCLNDGAFIAGGEIVMIEGGRVFGKIPIQDIGLKGVHNQENVMAAGLAAMAADVPFETIYNTVTRFKGLPHRLELVAQADGVRYYDDSKGTNVGAMMKSLESFVEPVILIAGGRDKDSDFSALKEIVKRKVKLLILIGEAAGKMEDALKGATVIKKVDHMEKAVSLARQNCEVGDVILLSPGCASFDMYQDYTERGKHFAEIVRKAIH